MAYHSPVWRTPTDPQSRFYVRKYSAYSKGAYFERTRDEKVYHCYATLKRRISLWGHHGASFPQRPYISEIFPKHLRLDEGL